MPCLVGCLSLSLPRVAIVLVVIFSDYIGTAYQTTIWPLLGFFFAPVTTLAYAFAMHSNNGQLDGLYLVLMVLAILADLGLLGGGSYSGRNRVRTRYREVVVERQR